MMERLGERVVLVAGDQKRKRAHLPEPKVANSRIPLVVANPSREADRGGGDGFRSPTTIGVSDWGVNGREFLWATWCVLDGGPRDRQLREESPRWKSGRRADREREAKWTKADRARFRHLWAGVVRLNGLAANRRGRGQTGADDQASAAGCSALVDVLPSDAGSVGGEVVSKRR